MSNPPLVTIVIASHARPDHLGRTLREVGRQQYDGGLEMIVVDDASPESLQPVVKAHWPGALFLRKEKNVGQCACRTEGFQSARGKYILQLDDDAHPVDSLAISRAVEILETRPEIGALNCYSFNGSEMPEGGLPPAVSRYCISFHGCAVFFRREALAAVGGYLDFLERHWEEEELSIRMMKAGWAVYFSSDIVVHHRLSGINRNAAWTWKHGVRNKLWGLAMHWPVYRLPVDMGWTLCMAIWDALRLRRMRALGEALTSFAVGLPRVLKLRKPMDRVMMRRYDALRFGREIRGRAEFANPPSTGIAELAGWFFGAWRNRPRERSFWDRRIGDIGSSDTVKFAHEYPRKRG